MSSWECVSVLLNPPSQPPALVSETTAFHDGCLVLNGFCCQRGIEREEEGRSGGLWMQLESPQRRKGCFKNLVCVRVCVGVYMCVCVHKCACVRASVRARECERACVFPHPVVLLPPTVTKTSKQPSSEKTNPETGPADRHGYHGYRRLLLLFCPVC